MSKRNEITVDSDRLGAFCKSQKITQAVLGDKLGISKSVINRYINEGRMPLLVSLALETLEEGVGNEKAVVLLIGLDDKINALEDIATALGAKCIRVPTVW